MDGIGNHKQVPKISERKQISDEQAQRKLASGKYRQVQNKKGGPEIIRERTKSFVLRIFSAVVAVVRTRGQILNSKKAKSLFQGRKTYVIKQKSNNSAHEKQNFDPKIQVKNTMPNFQNKAKGNTSQPNLGKRGTDNAAAARSMKQAPPTPSGRHPIGNQDQSPIVLEMAAPLPIGRPPSDLPKPFPGEGAEKLPLPIPMAEAPELALEGPLSDIPKEFPIEFKNSVVISDADSETFQDSEASLETEIPPVPDGLFSPVISEQDLSDVLRELPSKQLEDQEVISDEDRETFQDAESSLESEIPPVPDGLVSPVTSEQDPSDVLRELPSKQLEDQEVISDEDRETFQEEGSLENQRSFFAEEFTSSLEEVLEHPLETEKKAEKTVSLEVSHINSPEVEINKMEARMGELFKDLIDSELKYIENIKFALEEINRWDGSQDLQIQTIRKIFRGLEMANRAMPQMMKECFSADGKTCDTKALAETYESFYFLMYRDNIANCVVFIEQAQAIFEEQAKAKFTDEKERAENILKFNSSIGNIFQRLPRHEMIAIDLVKAQSVINDQKNALAQAKKEVYQSPRFKELETIRLACSQACAKVETSLAKYEIQELRKVDEHLNGYTTWWFTAERGKLEPQTNSFINILRSPSNTKEENIKAAKFILKYLRSYSQHILKIKGSEQVAAKAELKEIHKTLSENKWYNQALEDVKNNGETDFQYVQNCLNALNRCLES